MFYTNYNSRKGQELVEGGRWVWGQNGDAGTVFQRCKHFKHGLKGATG